MRNNERKREQYQAWLATQNMGTLKGREDLVLDWALQEELDVVALQEVRLDLSDRAEFSRTKPNRTKPGRTGQETNCLNRLSV